MDTIPTLDLAVGNTPLIELKNITKNLGARIFVKLECLNPWGSLKDRIAVEMIEQAEREGKLRKGGHVVEATSGNTGISLAALCATKGYKVTIILPEFVSEERKILLRMLGANLILTKEEHGLLGPVAKSIEFKEKNPDVFLADQTRNPNNPGGQRKTGIEIWEQSGSNIDIFVSASGTGGHLSGIGAYLKSVKPEIRIVAVEPEMAAVLSGQVKIGEAKTNHGIIGIGPGFIPQTLNRALIDDCFVVDTEAVYQTTREVIASEGLLIGPSSGAVILAALKLAAMDENAGKTIVTVAASQTERYMSTRLADEARAYVSQLNPSSVESKYMNQFL
jgi:cysteine synthase A